MKGDRRFRINNSDLPVEFKSHQWFGATVRSHGNTILACAPRYYWRTEHDVPFSDATGTCYLSVDDFHMFVEYAPCRTRDMALQVRVTAKVASVLTSPRMERLFLEGLAAFTGKYWQGQLISATTEEIIKAYYASYFLLSVTGQIQTKQAQGSYDDSYLGYSVAGGEFSGDRVEDFITGIPKRLMLYGLANGPFPNKQPWISFCLYAMLCCQVLCVPCIVISTADQEEKERKRRMGSYFGYAVAATDIDNNGLMDLVVGAPMFMRSLYGRVEEVGNVYVYLQQGSLVPGQPPSLQGTQAFGRFGSSLAPLGDLNQDGFNVLAMHSVVTKTWIKMATQGSAYSERQCLSAGAPYYDQP
ncbi:integrin alpha-5-like [Osmerus eperlanus]|uniref:integrin alpha-5-like n=1 Tax=Osmerus eperlanus TaxID=29151 RepID=UPI002E0D1275